MPPTRPTRRPARRKSRLSASRADKFRLYQGSVQAPEADARRLARLYRQATGRSLLRLREDFCGTAALSAAFVFGQRGREAVGVDLDAATLVRAEDLNLALLDAEQRSRVRLIQGDVLKVTTPGSELIAALNFSYSVFRTRSLLAEYFRQVTHSLVPGGMFVLDVWGGGEVMSGHLDRRRRGGFTYVWEHSEFNPVNHHATCRIHFEFPDGTRMRNAFVYHWRIWTIPELIDLLEEVGFEDVHVLWEGTDRRTGGGNGVFRRTTSGEMLRSFVAYIGARWPGRAAGAATARRGRVVRRAP